ncbi:MAG: TlpA family protein disulfide reductase [Bacteroidales bacterium]|nr:TlpA family protein disulfide reductase [Bacteroidales bacterium]
MKRLIIWASALLLLAACQQAPVARIYATLEGAGDSSVVLQKFNYNRLVPVDTFRTDRDGHFNAKVKLKGQAPYFYYLYLGGSPVASLVLLPSDQVTVHVPADGPFTVEGSEESRLFQELNASFTQASDQMKSLSASLSDASSDEEVKEVNKAMSRLYVDYKRQTIKYIVNHPRSITSAVALFQRFNENLPVFGQESDVVIFKTVQDSLMQVYPKSEYLTAIRDAIDAQSKNLALSSRLNDVAVISFPDLTMPDVDGQSRTLSDMEGKVIVLSFWSVAQDEHKLFNVDLAEIYAKYHDRGLEVYQVSLDIDKPSWASVVKSQKLPWTSVNDGLGIQSPAVNHYNVDRVPTMFVIDRSGDIAGRDVFDKDALEQMIRHLL